MSFQETSQDTEFPRTTSDEHQLYDMDQPPPQHNMHGPGPPGGPSQNMGFPSSGPPQDSNFGSFGYMRDGPDSGLQSGGDSGPMSGSERALQWPGQWQQMGANSQGAESGFVSGAATGPSSHTGHDELEGFHTGPGSISDRQSLYDLDSAQRSEVSSVHSSMSGVLNPEVTIPQLMNNLIDEDPVVVLETLVMVEKCAKKEIFFDAMIRNPDFVGAIVQALIMAMTALTRTSNALAAASNANESGNNTPNGGDGNNNPQLKALTEQLDRAQKQTISASNILRAMTNSKDPKHNRELENQTLACHNILRNQGIPPITNLLLCPIDRIKYNAIATIHSLLLCLETDPRTGEPAKQQIRESGGVETMVELLKSDNIKLLTILTDCLRILATKNQQTKDVILNRNGPIILVEIMKSRNDNYKNLITMTSRLLKVLSCCPKSKRVIIEAGGMEALAMHLFSEQPKVIMHCILTMRNMSDLASGIPDGERLCQDLVNMLQYREPVIVSCATGILANLTANNEQLKLAVCKANGVPELVRLIDKVNLDNKDERDILESALYALRHLTNNHQHDEQVQQLFVIQLNGLPIINRHLNPDTPRPSLKGILQVVRNLALKNGWHAAIKKEGLPLKIIGLLEWAMKGLSAPKGNNPCPSNVRLTEIVEAALGCMFYFSKDQVYQDIMRDANAMQLFKAIMLVFTRCPEENKGSTDTIIRLTAGIIDAISTTDLEGAYIVHREGLDEAVIPLSNHSNQKIAQFATAIMHNLSHMKNEEQRGNFHPSQHLQKQPNRSQMQDPNLQNIPPPGGNGFVGQAGFNQQGGPSHMQQPGGPAVGPFHPRNNFQAPNSGGPMSNNPGFDQMIADSGMHGLGPGGPPPPGMPIGPGDSQKMGDGYHQMPGPPRGEGRIGGGPPGQFMEDMSMQMDHMNVASPQYNQNYSGSFDFGSM